MNFLDWFRFSPRAGREEYVFINACCQLGSLAIYIAQSIFSMKTFSWQGVVFNLMIDLVILVLSLGIFWVFLAVSFRRMHDLNMPGWWFILCLIVIAIGSVLFFSIWWLFSILGLGIMLFLSLKKPADYIPNRFGKERAAFLPGLFARRGIFTAVLAAGILFSLIQTTISRVQLSHLQAMTQITETNTF